MQLAGTEHRKYDDRQHGDDQIHHIGGRKGHQPRAIGAQERGNDNDTGDANPVIDAQLIAQQGPDDVQRTAHRGQQHDHEGKIQQIYHPLDSPYLFRPVGIVVCLVNSGKLGGAIDAVAQQAHG